MKLQTWVELELYVFAAPALRAVVEGKEPEVISAADSRVSDPGIVVNIVEVKGMRVVDVVTWWGLFTVTIGMTFMWTLFNKYWYVFDLI